MTRLILHVWYLIGLVGTILGYLFNKSNITEFLASVGFILLGAGIFEILRVLDELLKTLKKPGDNKAER